MARYISILKKQEVPKNHRYDEVDLYEAADTVRMTTYAICGENDQYELDVLIMALAEAYAETKGIGNHEGEIDVMLTDVERRLRTSFLVHDQSMSEIQEYERQHPGVFDSDSQVDEDIEAEGEASDDEDSGDCRCEDENRNSWTSYENAVLIKFFDDDEYIVCPVPNLKGVICPCGSEPGFCMKVLTDMGYIEPEDEDQVERIFVDRVPVTNYRHPRDTYDIITKEFPETVCYGARV